MYTRNLKCNAKPSESNAAGASRETSLSHAAPVDPAVKKSGIMLNPEKAASQSHVSFLCMDVSFKHHSVPRQVSPARVVPSAPRMRA